MNKKKLCSLRGVGGERETGEQRWRGNERKCVVFVFVCELSVAVAVSSSLPL